MTQIAHVAVWCKDLEVVADFWRSFFGAQVGPRYESRRRAGFVSRFVRLDSGPALELMSLPALSSATADVAERPGWTHVAIALGSRELVDRLAQRAQECGALLSPPRVTGDGYYEAVICDPEGNSVEIVE